MLQSIQTNLIQFDINKNMIKKQQQQYYCLNPYCCYSTTRLCPNSTNHFNSHQCTPWILDPQSSDLSESPPFNYRQINALELNFREAPLKAILSVGRIQKSEWKKWLGQQQNRIKKDLNRHIQVEFQTISLKIQEIIESYSPLVDLITSVGSISQPQITINEVFKNYKLEQSQMKNLVLFNILTLKEKMRKVRENIEEIFSTFIATAPSKPSILSPSEQKQFHQHIFQPTESHYNKFQVVCSSVGKQATCYSMEGERINLECILCDRKLSSRIDPSNKKSVKKYLAEQMLSHLYGSHYEPIAFGFRRKAGRQKSQSLGFEQFLEQSKRFKTIKLVDRQSGVVCDQSYEQFMKSSDIFTMEIVSLSNQHMIKGRHLLVHSHESIDLMIAIIAYICSQRGQNLDICSKKEGLKAGLSQIMELQEPEQKIKVKVQNM